MKYVKLSCFLVSLLMMSVSTAGSFTQFTLLGVGSGLTAKAVLEDDGKTLRLVYDSADYGEEDADWFPIKTGYLNVSGTSRSNAILYGSIRELDAYLYVYSLEKIVVDPSFSSYTPTQAFGWFAGFPELTTIEGMANFNMSKMTSARYLFFRCPKLASIDLSGIDTSNVTDMSYMFYDCPALTSLDLSGFNTAKVTDMSYMFYCCSALTSLDLSSFDTSDVTSMSSMFYNCDSLTTLDLSGFNTAKVRSAGWMFGYCYALTTIYASEKFVTTALYSRPQTYVFYGCGKLAGGAGSKMDSTYDYAHSNSDYAHFDEPDNPGYFTQKAGLTPHDILFVDGTSGSDANEGHTSTSPKKTIAAALSAIAEGGRIYVSTGTYSPISTANRNVSIIGWERTGPVVIDGGNSQRCAYLGDSTNEYATVLRRFTLRNGKVYVDWCGVGGAGVKGGKVENCVISNCMVSGSWSGYGGEGGGVACSRLANCVLDNCQALAGGGIAYATAHQCIIRNCYARDDGGAAHSSDLFNCLVYANYGYNTGGGACGSALAGSVARNCTIVDNNARSGGTINGGFLYNCIVYGNTPTNFESGWNSSESACKHYSCWFQDPLFRDAANGDYRLALGSPCANAGNNAYVCCDVDLAGRPRIEDGTVDIGCYELRDYFKILDFTGTATFNDNEESDWITDTNTWHVGESSLRTAPVAYGESTSVKISVSGVGLLTFDWKTATYQNSDYIYCSVDGVDRLIRSGTRDWRTEILYLDTDTDHTIVWRFSKNNNSTNGMDCAWIDHLVWTPGAEDPGWRSRVYYWNNIQWRYQIKDGVASLGSGNSDWQAIDTENTSIYLHSYYYVPSTLDGYTVRAIGDYAFYRCNNINWSYGFPTLDNVTSIGRSAFEGCYGMRGFTVNPAVTNIGDRAFKDCSQFVNVVIPDTVLSYGQDVLTGCSNLNEVVFSRYLGNALRFSGCPKLKTIRYYGDVALPTGSYGDDLPGATLYVKRGSTGWGCAIPGTWCGLDIDYIDSLSAKLLEAMDFEGEGTLTEEDAPFWAVDTARYVTGGSAARSACLTSTGKSVLKLSVEGKGRLSFQWMIYSPSSSDYLRCYVDGADYGAIYGNTAWDDMAIDIESEGAHEIKWEYYKSGNYCYSSYDCSGWIDSLVWEPGGIQLARDVLLWAPSTCNSSSSQSYYLVPKLLNVLENAYKTRIPNDTRFKAAYTNGITVKRIQGYYYSPAALPGNLSRYALVFVVLPYNEISSNEVARLKTVVTRGGRVVLQAEHALFSPDENARLTKFAADMGAEFSILDGQKAGVDAYNPDCNLLSNPAQLTELPESKSVAPISYHGYAELVASLRDDTYYVWAVDEKSGNGRITVFSDNNWFCDSGSSSGTLYDDAIPFLERLLANAIENEQKVIDEEVVDIEEKIPDGCNVAVRDNNNLLTYYTNIWEACDYAKKDKDVTDRWTVVLKKAYYENFELPEGVTFETTSVTSNYTDYATISAPSQCEITTNVTHDIFRCVSVNAPAAPVVTASDGTYTNKIVVSWTVPESDKPITSYTIQRERIDNGFKQDPVTVTTNLYVDTDARSGVRYRYHVYATSSAGDGKEGTAEGLRNASGQVPDPVLSVEATGGTATNGVVVTWQPDTNTAIVVTKYELRRREKGSSNWTTVSSTISPTATEYTDATATPGKDYIYSVRVGNECGWSDSVESSDPGWYPIVLSVDPTSFSVPFEGATQSVAVVANTGWAVTSVVGNVTATKVSQDKLSVAVPVNPSQTAQTNTVTLVAGGDHPAYATVTVIQQRQPKLTDLEITPGEVTFEGGSSTNYTAIATYDDGTKRDVTGEVTWTVTPGEYGTISTNGVLTTAETTDTNRTATVKATLTQEGDETVTLTDTSDVTIGFTKRLLRPMSLTINGDDTIDAGATNVYTATVTYNDGTSVEKTLEAAWSLTPSGTVAQVVKGDENVKLTAAWTATGTLELKATYKETIATGAGTVDNLVAWYPFNGDAQDMSGNGNHGTVCGATLTADRDGNPDSAYSFNGKSWIQVANSASLKNITTTLTIAAWVKPTAWANNGTGSWIPVVCKGVHARQYGFQIQSTGRYDLEDYSGVCLYARDTPKLNEWHHFVISYDGKKMRAFLNGELQGEELVTTSFPVNSDDFFIGRDEPGALEMLTGYIDDVRIYNRALTPSEVAKVTLAGDGEVTVVGTKTVTVVALDPPSAPSVSATDGSATNSIALGWNEPTSARPIIAYEVSRQKKGEAGWTVLTNALVSTNYVDTTAEPGEDYTYRVRGSNEAGWGEYGSDDGWRAISLALDPTSWTAGYGATNCAVKVTANASWAITAATGIATTSTTTGGFTVSLAANTTLSDRSGSVTVTAGGSTDHPATATFTYTQAKRPAKLTGLEIVDGPSSIEGGSSTNFHVFAYFDDDSSNDVTTVATWSVEPASYGTITNGLLETYATTDIDRHATIKAVYEYTTYEPTTLTATKEIGIDFTMALLKPVSLWISGPTEGALGVAADYRAYAAFNNATTNEVTLDASTKWSVTPENRVESRRTDAAFSVVPRVPAVTNTVSASYAYRTNSVSASLSLAVPEIVSLPIAVDIEDADISTGGLFRVIQYNLNFSPKTIGACERAIISPSTWITPPVTGRYETISFEDGLWQGVPHYKTVSFPGNVHGKYDWFACLITGKMLIPEAGLWTFACNIDDGFQFDLTGHGASYVFKRDGITSFQTDLITFDIKEAGVYDIRAVYYDQGVEAVLCMGAAKGRHYSFDSSFSPIGDASCEIKVMPLKKNSDLELKTGGVNGWYGQLAVNSDRVDAGQSGYIPGAGESWMSTTVTNAGTLTFTWKVSSEPLHDALSFAIDGEKKATISGTSGEWRTLTFDIPFGTHDLRWTYAKDDKLNVDADAAWVDKIVWTPIAPPDVVLDVTATDGTSPDETRVTWSSPASGKSGTTYEVRRAVRGTTDWEVLTSTHEALTYHDTTAVPGVEYTYCVRAGNLAGWGPSALDDGWRACSLSLDPSELFFSHAGGSNDVSVAANADWTFSGDSEWLTAESPDTNTLHVAVLQNGNIVARTGTVSVVVGEATPHAVTGTVLVVQTRRPPRYDVGFFHVDECWRTRMQISTNTTEHGVYAPVSVFSTFEPLELSFGWTNRSEVAVSPAVRFRLFTPLSPDAPVSEWTVREIGELGVGEGTWSGGWPIEVLPLLKPGDYRLEAEIGVGLDDVYTEGELDADKADNTAVFRFAVRDPALDAIRDVFGEVGITNVEFLAGNDFAQPPHVAPVDGYGASMQFGPYVPMNGKVGRVVRGKAPLDLVFLIDVTGSMSGCIDGLKTNVRAFFQTLVEGDADHAPITDWRAKVIGYRDVTCDYSWYEDHGFTTDVDAFNSHIAACRATGGGDYEESLLDAIWRIAKETEFREDASRAIVAFTDAAYKTPMSYGDAAGGKWTAARDAAKAAGIDLQLVSSAYESSWGGGLALKEFAESISTNSTYTYVPSLSTATLDGERLQNLARAVSSGVKDAKIVEPMLSCATHGGGTLSFDWKNDAVDGTNNTFRFECVSVTNLENRVGSGWQHVELEFKEGWHLFQWTYGKRNYRGRVSDRGIVSNLRWEPLAVKLDIQPVALPADQNGLAAAPHDITVTNYEGEAIGYCIAVSNVEFKVDDKGNVTNTVIAYGGKFKVDCNAFWKVTDCDDWIKPIVSEGEGDGELIVEIAANTNYYPRTGFITVRAGESDVATGTVERTVHVKQAEYIPPQTDVPQILTVDVKPRWPWNDTIDIDYRVVLAKDNKPLKITFQGVNNEGGQLGQIFQDNGAMKKYFTPDSTHVFTNEHVTTTGKTKGYAICPTSGWYRVTWRNAGADLVSDEKNTTAKLKEWATQSGMYSFHSPAFAIKLMAQRLNVSEDAVSKESLSVRLDTRLIGVGGQIMTGTELIGHPTGGSPSPTNPIDPVAVDTTVLSNGMNCLDKFIVLPPSEDDAETAECGFSSNNYTHACVINRKDVAIEGGNITEDTIWGADKIHLVRDNVYVQPGATLTIAHGAVVKFCYWSRIFIYEDPAVATYCKERYNIRVRGAYLYGASWTGDGDHTIYDFSTSDGQGQGEGSFSMDQRFYSQTSYSSSRHRTDEYNEGYALLGVRLMVRTGSGMEVAAWKGMYYTMEEPCGVLDEPEDNGNGYTFFGWTTKSKKTLPSTEYSKDAIVFPDTVLYAKKASKPAVGYVMLNAIQRREGDDGWENGWDDTASLFERAEASSGTIILDPASVVYDGKSHKDDVFVEDVIVDGEILKADYYSKNLGSGDYVNAGNYAVTVDFTKSYKNSPTATFRILPRPVAGGSFAIAPTSAPYEPGLLKSAVKVSSVMIPGMDTVPQSDIDAITLNWLDADSWPRPGTYAVEARFNGNYSGTLTNSFTVLPNPEYYFEGKPTEDDVRKAIDDDGIRSDGRAKRVLYIGGDTNNMITARMFDMIREDFDFNEWVKSNFVVWVENPKAEGSSFEKYAADLPVRIEPLFAVLSATDLTRPLCATAGYVTNLWEFLETALELPDDASSATVTLSETTFVRTGEPIHPSVTVTYGGAKLPAANYDLVYADGCTEVGTYWVKAVFKPSVAYGDYGLTGETARVSFEIVPSVLLPDDVVLTPASTNYDGLVHLPSVSVKTGIAHDVDYGSGFYDSIGDYTVSVTSTDPACTGRVEKTFSITARAVDADDVTVTLDQDSVSYYGTKAPTNAVRPSVTQITDGTHTYREGTDYDVTYGEGDWMSPGTYYLTITFKNGYSGKITVPFTITHEPQPVTEAFVELSMTNYVFTTGAERGSAVHPAVTRVWDADRDYEETTDYVVTYGDGDWTSNGIYAVCVTFTNNYSGTARATFTIGEVEPERKEGLPDPSTVLTAEDVTNAIRTIEWADPAVTNRIATVAEYERFNTWYTNMVDKVGKDSVDGAAYAYLSYRLSALTGMPTIFDSVDGLAFEITELELTDADNPSGFAFGLTVRLTNGGSALELTAAKEAFAELVRRSGNIADLATDAARVSAEDVEVAVDPSDSTRVTLKVEPPAGNAGFVRLVLE